MSRKRIIRYARELSDEEHAAFLAEANARETRTRGRRGLKLISRGAPDEDWSALVEALVEHGTIDRSDQTEACKSEWLKDFTCPGCGSSSGFARRDKGTKYTGIRITCSHRCKTGDVLRTLGLRSEELGELTWNGGPVPQGPSAARKVEAEPVTLDQAHDVFRRWLGDDYDLDALDAMLAAAAVERLNGDPVWLLIISGSGNAKTETVQALAGIGAHVASTIASEGALLSGSPRKEHGRDATGGLLREVGDRGVLVIKDVTSILSMQRDLRGQVLGALREIHDGQWTRKVGTDGGRSLPWSGRIAVVGAVTTAWDQAHAVIASMGDRFVLVRVDSTVGRQNAGRRAIGNTGTETQMRADLAAAVAGVIAGMNPTPTMPTSEETETLLAAADLVTLARTGVEYDYRGDVIDAHAPEMPTRFAKELAQILRGAIAIGIDRTEALRLAMRCARDSMPPLRLAIVEDLAQHPGSSTADVRKRLNKPRATVDRQLQALHMLGVLEVDEEAGNWNGRESTRWYYTIRADLDPAVLNPKSVPEMSVGTLSPLEERERDQDTLRTVTDISGTDPPTCGICHRPNLLTPASVERGVCVVCRQSGAA